MRYVGTAVIIVGAATLSGATGAVAEDKSGYTLFNPTPDRQLRDMSTDRPDATESPYTVDAGRIQLEMDLAGYTQDRRDGVTTRAVEIAPFNLKIGMTNSADLQIAYDSFSRIRTSGGGARENEAGFGDLTIRWKQNIWGNDGGRTAFAIMPFVKLPTNNIAGLNNDLEGGLIVPIAIDLGSGVGLGLMTEVDILRTADGSDYEPAFVNSAVLGFELNDQWGMYVEAFVEHSAEDGAETIVTLNGGFTYAVTKNLQLDAGANVGGTDAADDLRVFAGLSRRY